MDEQQKAKHQYAATLGSFGGPQKSAGNPMDAMQLANFHQLPWPRKPIGKGGHGQGSFGKHQGGRTHVGKVRKKRA